MDKNIITKTLKNKLEPLDYIYAFWLEGADANDTADEYSDIDYYIDFEDEYEEEAIKVVEDILAELGTIDYKYVMNHGHSKLRQRIYHIEGTSEYLMIDFCWQLHSREKMEYVLIKNDPIEAAKVIFDKDNIIRYKKFNPNDYQENNSDILIDSKYRYTQHARVIKYVYREQYAEAYAYYNRYVVEPLINLLRLRYTPAHVQYYLIHISSHIPKEEIKKLEDFIKVGSLEDINNNIKKAQVWFKQLLEEIE